MPRLLTRSARFLLALAMLLAAATAGADPVRFGARSLDIPPPAGFVPIAAISPKFLQTLEAYLPAGNRLAETYTTPADAMVLGAGKPAKMTRYFQLQVLRALDGVAISEKEFQDNARQMEEGIAQSVRDSEPLNAQIEHGNAAVERATSANPKAAMSGLQYLGMPRREPWGLFFTMQARFTATGSVDQKMVVGGAVILVNRQLLVLGAYTRLNNERDRRWAEQAVSAWADAIRAANAK